MLSKKISISGRDVISMVLITVEADPNIKYRIKGYTRNKREVLCNFYIRNRILYMYTTILSGNMMSIEEIEYK